MVFQFVSVQEVANYMPMVFVVRLVVAGEDVDQTIISVNAMKFVTDLVPQQHLHQQTEMAVELVPELVVMELVPEQAEMAVELEQVVTDLELALEVMVQALTTVSLQLVMMVFLMLDHAVVVKWSV